jgi:ribosomal protein L21E
MRTRWVTLAAAGDDVHHRHNQVSRVGVPVDAYTGHVGLVAGSQQDR